MQAILEATGRDVVAPTTPEELDLALKVLGAEPAAPTIEPETKPKPERREAPIEPSTPIKPFTPPPESEPGRVPSCPPGKHYPTCELEQG